MKMKFERHVQTADYCYDAVSFEADDVPDEERTLWLMTAKAQADEVLPTPAEPQPTMPPMQQAPTWPTMPPMQQYPQPTMPMQMPPMQQMPVTAPAAPGMVMSLQEAEAVISPCGDSKGAPLASCTDKDLEYLQTYKKTPGIRTAAAIVLNARRMGQTVQR